MARLRVVDPNGLPVKGADVRVTMTDRDFDKSYLTDGNGEATIAISPLYVGSTAHTVVKKTSGLITKYAAFDWPVNYFGLDPREKTIELVSTNAPDSTFNLIRLMNKYTLAIGVTAALVIGVVVLVK